MARSKGKSSGSKGKGGGRTATSEPKMQVFKDFNGLDFQYENRFFDEVAIDSEIDSDGDQTYLQMNYVFLQNNVDVTTKKTLETRNGLVRLFNAPDGQKLSGVCCLQGSALYLATKEQRMYRANLVRNIFDQPRDISTEIDVTTHTGLSCWWTSIGFYDDKLVALTEAGEVFVGDLATVPYFVDAIENAKKIPDPTTDFTGHLTPKGSLSLSMTEDASHPFRTAIGHTYVNRFGPTKMSPLTTFWTNVPVSEWSSACYLVIDGVIPSDYDIRAVELYYATDNVMEPIFLGRTDVASSSTTWKFTWYGYIDATATWPVANLIVPTENYTTGPHASYVSMIDGRMYFYGGGEKEWDRVYIGGNPGNLLSVSPGVGGGFVDIEPGSSKRVMHVCKYKTQSGSNIVTMICDSPNSSKSYRYNLVENTAALSNEQSMQSWQAEQVAGAVGCKSHHGAIVCQDGLYTINRYGLALTTMTMEYNSQIRTNYISDAIKPVFIDETDIFRRLGKAHILECDGIIYMALGSYGYSYEGDMALDNVIFCYDIDLKAWWTYTLDLDKPIMGLFHVDCEDVYEGIGIITEDAVYCLPTTGAFGGKQQFLIETAEISTQMPQQGWQYISQLEFHFDKFEGDAEITVRMIDMFGRHIKVRKAISESEMQYDYTVWMRIDQRVMSYVITLSGVAEFRLTHFIARVYTMSSKVGQVWGFDSSISHRSAGDVLPTLRSYNDVRKAIFT